MKYGICLIASMPVRISQSNKSEMVSQLLFGESYAVLEEKKEWIKISCSYDNYSGWIDKNFAIKISEQSYKKLNRPPFWVLNKKIIGLTLEDGTEMKIVPGSTLPFFDPSKRIFNIEEKSFIINEKPETGIENATAESVIKTAFSYINAPYLWGGRSLFGIDCSGLAQIVYKINHMNIPRDASQQALVGKPVNNIKEALPGDLAFFNDNEGKISHVGIMAKNERIIHASGRVKIEKVDSTGIFSEEKQEYTHQLNCIRRLI